MDPRALGEVLRRLVDEDELAFDALFDPMGARTRVQVAPEIAAALREARLAEGDDDELWGLSRARRLGRRFYFLELGEGLQYHQDVWPETDALLGALEGKPAGRFLDVGTGCGILAIEAAARGHSVVATDLYETAVELARWNAELNGVGGIDFRAGHLFDPVAGEKFDLILTAPHYGRVFDQLRLEVLRCAARMLGDGGRLFLATALEWEEGAPLGVESVLRSGRVTPIVAPHRNWFTFRVSDGEVPRLGSRHRFLVEIGGEGLAVTMPPTDSQPTERVVPLARLRAPSTAAVVTRDDGAALRALLEALALPDAELPSVPTALVDACRFGARSCASAAGALVDVEGAVRPCTHGGEVARAEHSLAELSARLQALAGEAEARRGCASCAARPVCSQCLFPTPFDEASYCELIRAHAATIPHLHRLLDGSARLGGLRAPIRVERWPRPSSSATPAWPELTRRWNQRALWIVRDGDRISLWGSPALEVIDAQLAWLGARVGDGADAAEVEATRAAAGVSPRRLRALVERLAGLLG